MDLHQLLPQLVGTRYTAPMFDCLLQIMSTKCLNLCHTPSTFCTFEFFGEKGFSFFSDLVSGCETSLPQKAAFDRTQSREALRQQLCDWMAGWGAKGTEGSDWWIFNICTFVSLTYDVLRLKRFVGGVFRSSVRYERSGDYNCFPNCLFEQQPSQLVLGLCFLQYHCPTHAACLYEFFKPALAFNYICIYKVSASVIS